MFHDSILFKNFVQKFILFMHNLDFNQNYNIYVYNSHITKIFIYFNINFAYTMINFLDNIAKNTLGRKLEKTKF